MPSRILYWGGALVLTLLIGALIPSALVASSPAEFVEPSAYRNPVTFIISSLCISGGFFLCWLTVFYSLAAPLGKRRICLGLWISCGIASVDYFLFAKNPGIISADLEYKSFPVFTVKGMIIQLACLATATAVMVILWKKKQVFISGIYAALIVSLSVMTCLNITEINKVISETDFSLITNTKDLFFALLYAFFCIFNSQPCLSGTCLTN